MTAITLQDVQTVSRAGWVHLVMTIVHTAIKFLWTAVIVNVTHAIPEVAAIWNVQIMENAGEINVSVTLLKAGGARSVKYQVAQALEKIVQAMVPVTVLTTNVYVIQVRNRLFLL